MPEEIPQIVDELAPSPGEPWRIVWTRGEGCAGLAAALSDHSAARADSDLKGCCIRRRANVLVTAKAGGFDLAGSIVPYSFDPARPVPAVIGAIGTGPHSPFVAETTKRLASGLGADPMLVTMAREDGEASEALEVLERVSHLAPAASTKCIRAETAAELIEALPDEAVIVLGAPGGSWWQRQFFGPGRRLLHAAPAGAIVVRAVARRCFHSVSPLTGVGTPMRAGDALAVAEHPVIPVVEEGKIVGIVRSANLRRSDPDAIVGDVMEAPVMLHAADAIAEARDLRSHFEGSPIPVVDEDGHLLGGIDI